MTFVKQSTLILLVFFSSTIYCFEESSSNESKDLEVLIDEDCIEKTFATEDDVHTLKSFQLPNSKTGRCLLACMYKKISIITPEGKFSIEGGISAMKKAFDPFPSASKHMETVVERCSSIAYGIQDDYEGCETAASLFTCVLKELENCETDDDSDEDLEP